MGREDIRSSSRQWSQVMVWQEHTAESALADCAESSEPEGPGAVGAGCWHCA